MTHDDDEEMFEKRAAAMALLEGDGAQSEDEPDDVDIAGVAAADPADSLVHKTSLRANKWNELNRIARFARINPPTVLQGVIGGQQPVPSGQKRQVVNWGGEDAETSALTVTLGPVQPFYRAVAKSANDRFRSYGIVQFGTRGFLVKAEVDIGNGCQFTVTGSSITVEVAVEPAGAPAFEIEMLLTGMISFHTIARTAPLTRTRYVDALLTGTSSFFDVPPFAKNVVFWRTPTASAATLNFYDWSGNLIYSFILAGGASMFDPILLAADVAQVEVVNASGVTVDGRLIFGLDI